MKHLRVDSLLLFALLPAAALAACNPDGTELCCDSVVETNCLSFSRPSWGGVSATNDCDGASFVLTGLQSGSVRYEIVQSWTPKPGYDGKCPDPEPAFTVRADVVPEVAWTLQSGDWTTNGTGEVATMPRSAGVCSARCEFTVSWPATACSGSGSETVSSSAVFTNAVVVSEIPPPRICTLNDHHSPHGFLVDLACPDEGWTPSIVPGADGANAIVTQIDRTAKTFRAQGTRSGLDAKAVVTAECGEGFTPFDVVALGDLRLGDGCGCKPGATDSTDEDADATAYETMVGKPEEGAKATLEQDYEPEKWGVDVLFKADGASPGSGSFGGTHAIDLSWSKDGSVSNLVDSWFDCEPDRTRADDEPKRRLILAVAYFTGLEFQGSSVEGQEAPVSATADFGNGSSKRCAYVCAPGDTLDIKAVTVIPEGRELSLAKTAEQPEDKRSAMNVNGPEGSGNHWTLKVPDDCAEGTFTLELKDPGHSCVTEEYDILVQGCGCSTCDEFGKGTRKTHSLDISFGLGRTATGSALPPLRVRSDDLSADFEPPLPPIRRYVNGELVTPQASSPVSYKAAAGGGGYTLDTAEGSVSVSSSASSIQVSYTRTGETDPFVEYGLVKTNGVATLTETRNGVARRVDRWTQDADGSWRLDTLDPDGTVLESEELLVSTPLLERRRSGGVLRETVWEEVAGHGRVVVRETVGEGADARSTVTRPVASGPADGLVRSEVSPDGSWTLRDYDAQRRPVSEIAPFGDTAPVLDATGAVTGWDGPVVRRTWSYAPVDPRDDGSVESDSPRTTVVAVGSDAAGWTETSRSYAAYFETGAERVALSERAAAAGAAYGATGALRSETRTHAPGTPHAGRLASSLSEHGMLTRHAYAFGAWDPASPHEFTSGIDDGGFLLETSFTTPAAHPDGVPRKTMLERSVRNARGDLVYTATRLLLEGGETALLSWTLYGRDAAGREIRRESSDGSLVETSWACCGPEWRRDETGIVTDYAYDAAGRLVLEQRGTVQTEHRYDAAGREIETIRRGLPSGDRPATALHPATRGYDALGRLAWSEGEDGIRLEYRYGVAPGGGETRTVIRGAGTPLATTNETVSLRDGSLSIVRFNGRLKTTYLHEPFAETTYEGSKGLQSPRWSRTERDFLGRAIRSLSPGFGGATLFSESDYDAVSRVVSTRSGYEPADPVSNVVVRSQTLFVYDDFGDRILSARDVDRNGLVDLAGPDIVSSNETAYVQMDGDWWLSSSVYSFPDTGSDEPLRGGTSLVRLTGLGANAVTSIGCSDLVSESVSRDALGNAFTNRAFRNRAAESTLSIRTTPASVLATESVSLGGLAVTNRSSTGVYSVSGYDTLNRPVSVTDGRGNTTRLAYDSFGRVAWTEDASGARTTFGYDALGRQTSISNALGLVTTKTYDENGNVAAERGATYPVSYFFDEYGRMTGMETYRTEDLAHGDRTSWIYDEATGLLLRKLYADGKGPAYDYSPDGRLSRRTWARGVATDYTRDDDGDLLALDYSDGTPSVRYVRDRLGRILSSTVEGVATNVYAYDHHGRVTNEWQNGVSIVRSYDALGREAGYELGGGVLPGSSVEYVYDNLGRFASVGFSTNRAEYAYLPGSDLVSGYSIGDFRRSVFYETQRNLIAAVTNSFGTNLVSAFDYASDILGRRMSRLDTFGGETTQNTFGYNDRSEVVSAAMGDHDYAYAYDPIGNRTSSTEDGATSVYEANELNQYAAIGRATGTEEPAYDDDGNMTETGDGWFYEWNGENRMVLASNAVHVVRYAYDARGRMVSKRVEGPEPSVKTQIWDGWNIILENDSGVPTVNVWGLDIDGTLQGAGGVGGLLAVLRTDGTFFPAYDANGNVTEYACEFGQVFARCFYGASGSIVFESGITETTFTHYFNTKPFLRFETLVSYQYRLFHPALGRWTTRDMLGEFCGVNLYEALANDFLSSYDILGFEESYKWTRIGHHIIPVAVVESLEKTAGKWNDNLLRAIDNKRIPTTVRHTNAAHAQYNLRVEISLEKYIFEAKVKPTSAMSEKEAEKWVQGFISSLESGSDDYIKTFLDKIRANTTSKELAKWAKEYKSEARLGMHQRFWIERNSPALMNGWVELTKEEIKACKGGRMFRIVKHVGPYAFIFVALNPTDEKEALSMAYPPGFDFLFVYLSNKYEQLMENARRIGRGDATEEELNAEDPFNFLSGVSRAKKNLKSLLEGNVDCIQ